MATHHKFPLPENVQQDKRLFLKASLTGVASAALAACGGSGDQDELQDELEPSEDAPTPVEYIDVPEALVPAPSTWDLLADPLERVQGATHIRVIQDGAPLAGVAVEGHGADDTLCFSGVTDSDGAYVWEGERTMGLRVVAHGPAGLLSLYAVQNPKLALAPLVLNVATTLADRVRLQKNWLPSQAQLRVQRFLSIQREVDLSISFIDHHEFDHARFAQAREQAGLSQDAFIDRLAAQAARDDYYAHSVDFGRPLSTETDALRISSVEFIENVLRYAKLINDANLPNNAIIKLFGALTLDIIGRFLPKDDPVMQKLNEISRKIDDVQRGLEAILNELKGLIEDTKRAGLTTLDAQLATLNINVHQHTDSHENQRISLLKALRQFNLHNDLSITTEILRFFGGFGTSFAQSVPTYLFMFRRFNSLSFGFDDKENIRFGLEPAQGAITRKTFYSKDSERTYLSALINIQLLYIKAMAWVMTYESGMASSLADLPPGTKDEDGLTYQNRISNLKAYAKNMMLFHAFFEDLKAFKPLPHPCVFLHVPDGTGWFADPENYVSRDGRIGFYGGWHAWDSVWKAGKSYKPWNSRDSVGNLRQAYLKLPAEVRKMAPADAQWGPPTRAMLESAFLKPMHDTSQSMQALALKAGGPSGGFYGFNEQGKPKFSIWLSDLSPVRRDDKHTDRYNHNAWNNSCKSGFSTSNTAVPAEYRRYYAKMETLELKSKRITFRARYKDLAATYCRMGADVYSHYIEDYKDNPGERGVTYLGNYGEDKNFYYPALKSVQDVELYYPWQRYADVYNATNGFNIEAMHKRYGLT